MTPLIRHFGGQTFGVVCSVFALIWCVVDTSYQSAFGVVCLWMSWKGMIFKYIYHKLISSGLQVGGGGATFKSVGRM